jgi:hypothetical protein
MLIRFSEFWGGTKIVVPRQLRNLYHETSGSVGPRGNDLAMFKSGPRFGPHFTASYYWLLKKQYISESMTT